MLVVAPFASKNDGADSGDESEIATFAHTEGADCGSCHSGFDSHYPTIGEVRGGNCLDCHSNVYLRSEFSDWTHPVKDPALVGKTCVDCHSISEDGSAAVPERRSKSCLECHSDIRREVNLISRHPVSERLTECFDCHAVHKQNRIALTYDEVEFFGVGWLERHDPLKQNASCLACHPYFTLTGIRSSGFVIANTVNLHQTHMERGFAACIDCHTPHGSFSAKLVKDRIQDGTPLMFVQGGGMGTCSVKCHSHTHIQTNYGIDPQLLSGF